MYNIDPRDWHYILTQYAEYDYMDRTDCTFIYEYENHHLREIYQKYIIPNISISNDQFRNIVNLMAWVNDTLIGDGMCKPPSNMQSIYILEETINHGLKSNCWMCAVVLNELCLAMGYPSRMIRCMPIDLEFKDCHCVTSVYIQKLQKWVVFDPANRAYYVSREAVPLSLSEIRKALISDVKLFIPSTKRDLVDALCKYWIKTLFRFECYSVSCYGIDTLPIDKVMYRLNPKNFKMNDAIYETPNGKISVINLYNEDGFWKNPGGHF